MSDFAARLDALEKAVAANGLPDTIAVLQRKLEQNWQPDASVLLQAGSITGDALAPRTVDDDNLKQRSVRGAVSSAGAVVRGIGFSVTAHPSAGVYTVTYTAAFDSTPVLTFGLGATGGVTLIKATAESASSFSVVTYVSSGANTDIAFSFHAVSVEG